MRYIIQPCCFQEEHARIKALKQTGEYVEAESTGALNGVTGDIARRWSTLSTEEKAAVNERAAKSRASFEQAKSQVCVFVFGCLT